MNLSGDVCLFANKEVNTIMASREKRRFFDTLTQRQDVLVRQLLICLVLWLLSLVLCVLT